MIKITLSSDVWPVWPASKSHPFDEILGRLSISYADDYIHRNGSDVGIPVLFPHFSWMFLKWKLYIYLNYG